MKDLFILYTSHPYRPLTVKISGIFVWLYRQTQRLSCNATPDE